jgi:ketosteroid isomerase-like protein
MQESGDVRQALLRFYEAFSAGDAAGFERVVSREPDGMVIGTGPSEWLDGREAWLAGYREQITAVPGIRLEAGDLRAWEEGGVGWAADQPRFVLPDGAVLTTRLTAVLRQEDGEWRLVQAHFSVGVPDELAVDLSAQHGS